MRWDHLGIARDKSTAELDKQHRAACLLDDTLNATLINTHSGVFEGDILADMQGAVFSGGGDYAGNEFIIDSDKRNFLCRHPSGRRNLDTQDQLTLEWSGAYVRYHVAMM